MDGKKKLWKNPWNESEGPGEPMKLVQDEDEYLDVVRDQLEQILVFSDSEEEDSE